MGLFRVRRLAAVGAFALSALVGTTGLAAFGPGDTAFAAVAAQAGPTDDEIDLDGVVEAMPATGFVGTWQISGRTVTVTDATVIDQEEGQLAVGMLVEVEGAEQADGSILARELEVTDQDD